MSAWGTAVPSAWANASAGDDDLPAPLPALAGDDPEEAFPSLDAAVKAPSRRKKTAQKMSLNDFQSGKFLPRSKRELTQAEIRAMLPTAPLPKEEQETKLEVPPLERGSYNRYGAGGGNDRERPSEEGRRGYGFGEGRQAEGGRRGFGFGGGDRYERGPGGGFASREELGQEPLDEGPCRADEVDDWKRTKKFEPTAGDVGGARRGFGDREERRGFGFHDRPVEDLGPSPADEADNWCRGKKFQPSAGERAVPHASARSDNESRWSSRSDVAGGERPKLQLKPRSAVASDAEPTATMASKSSIFGDAKPVSVTYKEEEQKARSKSPTRIERGHPRGFEGYKDRRPADYEVENPSEAAPPPTGERKKLSLQPRSAAAGATTVIGHSSIFGGARPREEALAEKGRDWRKEDLALEHKLDRKPTGKEKALSEQIELLKNQVEQGQGDAVAPGEEEITVQAKLTSLELELTKLTLETDDKIRFSKRHPKEKDGSANHGRHANAAADEDPTLAPESAE